MALSFDEIVVSKSQTPKTRPKIILERVLHFLAYHFILSRRSTRHVSVAGLDLTVGPTVFDPRFFLTSEFFAEFILGLDLRGKRVADIGTGSGILAIAAAKAGASKVLAIDINPYA
ncbi:MAG: 50S ribosomal protein L11 methyltransferase, partial [Bradyrhizobium sp.]